MCEAIGRLLDSEPWNVSHAELVSTAKGLNQTDNVMELEAIPTPPPTFSRIGPVPRTIRHRSAVLSAFPWSTDFLLSDSSDLATDPWISVCFAVSP